MLDGSVQGITLPPFDYTNLTVVGVKRFTEACMAEKERVKPLKGVWRREGYGYEERYGSEAAPREIMKTVITSGKLIPVTLVSHAQRSAIIATASQ